MTARSLFLTTVGLAGFVLLPPARASAVTYTNINANLAGVYGSSVAWGDYDSDGDLDIALMGYGAGQNAVANIYRNTNGIFTDIGVSFPQLMGADGWMVWGDYDADGDLDLVVTGVLNGPSSISRIYRNNNGTFVDTQAGLTGVYNGSAAWGDYDRDGDLDLLITGGLFNGQPSSALYRNDSGVFIDVFAGLPGVREGIGVWGDYDNDGDLDILMAGTSALGVEIATVYKFDHGAFTDIQAGLIPVYFASGAWGDYDQDGDLDILLGGSEQTGARGRIYRNDGGVFSLRPDVLPPAYDASFAWGDHDNDGDLDILVTGHEGGSSYVYRNDNGTFVNTAAPLIGVGTGSAGWGDYDNDGDLDILISGRNNGVGVTRLYSASGLTPNSVPSAPTNLDAVVGADVTLSWDSSVDTQTAAAALSYNLRMGTTPGGSQVISPMSRADGRRRIVALGNVQQNRVWDFERPATPGIYYWSVQAIDGAYAGSPFGPEGSFEITGVSFTDASAGVDGAFRCALEWGDYDNDEDLDFVLAGETGSEWRSRIYRNDSGVFTDIQAGLQGVRWAAVAWGDIDGDEDLDLALAGESGTGDFAEIYRNSNGVFAPIGAGLPGVSLGSLAWGDYDNDGDLDLLHSGSSGGFRTAGVYRNTGGVFTSIGAGLEGVFQSSGAWGDYDGDDDLDILLTGYPSSPGALSRIYRNDAGAFTDIGAGLEGVWSSSVAWGDYDADDDLDILLVGMKESGQVAHVYRNDGDEFVDLPTGLPGVYVGSAAWGDHDNDGDLDALITGFDGASGITRVYANVAGVFTDIAAGLPNLRLSKAAWGDYDNDGDLDVLTAGYTGSAGVCRIYTSTGALPPPLLAPPTGLAEIATPTEITFIWDSPAGSIAAGSTATSTATQSTAAGFGASSYNLRVGTSPGASDVVPAMSDAESGFRRIVALGNAQGNTSWTLHLTSEAQTYYWSVQAIGPALSGSGFSPERSVIPDAAAVSEPAPIGTPSPSDFELAVAAPNPFGETTRIEFALPRQERIRLTVYDAAGRQVRVLADLLLPPGRHSVAWDGKDGNGQAASPGAYFYELQAGARAASHRVVLTR